MDAEAWKTIGTALGLCLAALGLVKHYWDTREKAAERAARREEKVIDRDEKRDERASADYGRFRKELLDMVESQSDELLLLRKELKASLDECERLRQQVTALMRECHQLRFEHSDMSNRLKLCEAQLNQGGKP